MVDRIDMWAPVHASGALFRGLALCGWMEFAAGLAFAAPPPSAPAPAIYLPHASFVAVERSFATRSFVSIPGAGVRLFEDPEAEGGGTERFDIRWYANPPGIPPGAVVLLESIQERSPVLKNHPLRFNEKVEGHVRTIIEIPPDEIRKAGRILKWRVRVVWRGRLLASQASANWDG